ncbi:hypothetical protein BOX15_Mlig019265g1 [Macrostomum lignano]|uniref:Uncharacterized protein n=1 Tax=Macrostomum lignano TaxID=282301 RepID=A0A267F989_9PLAT|nr:hypothetical protein BOX15_Mlig019265g1 [Macrostomum lignano]
MSNCPPEASNNATTVLTDSIDRVEATAVCNGVIPSQSGLLGSDPSFSNSLQAASSARSAAQCNRV